MRGRGRRESSEAARGRWCHSRVVAGLLTVHRSGRQEEMPLPALLWVWLSVSKWLLWILWIVSLKLGPLCCEGDAQALGHSSPSWHSVVWRAQREGNNSERKRFCSDKFPLSIYYTCPNLPGLVRCQILAQLSLPGAALDFFGHSWLIFTEVTWTAQPGNPKFADQLTWQSSTPGSLPGSIPFFFA